MDKSNHRFEEERSNFAIKVGTVFFLHGAKCIASEYRNVDQETMGSVRYSILTSVVVTWHFTVLLFVDDSSFDMTWSQGRVVINMTSHAADVASLSNRVQLILGRRHCQRGKHTKIESGLSSFDLRRRAPLGGDR